MDDRTRSKAACVLAIVGSLNLLAGTVLHWGAYPLVRAALTRSNVSAGLQGAMRTVFLSVGSHWILIAIIAVLACFSKGGPRRAVVLLCGITLLVDAAVMFSLVGAFIGSEMMVASAILFLCAGAALPTANSLGRSVDSPRVVTR